MLQKHQGVAIVIAHRLTTVKNCDKICVIDKGAKVEEGTHEELMAIDVETHEETQAGNSEVAETAHADKGLVAPRCFLSLSLSLSLSLCVCVCVCVCVCFSHACDGIEQRQVAGCDCDYTRLLPQDVGHADGRGDVRRCWGDVERAAAGQAAGAPRGGAAAGDGSAQEGGRDP